MKVVVMFIRGLTFDFALCIHFRNGSSSSNSGIHSISSLLTIRPLYHYPHPNLPVFTSMAFEALFLFYLLCALVLQHVNIYKMVSVFFFREMNVTYCNLRAFLCEMYYIC